MSIAPSEDVPDHIKETYVIDQDVHYGPLAEDLRPYIDDETARRTLKKIADNSLSDGYGLPRKTRKFDPTIAVGGEQHHLTHRIRTGEDVVEAASTMGVDMPIVATEYFARSASPYRLLNEEIVRAWNDKVLDDIVTADADIKAWIMLPQWDVDAMLAELDRVGDEKDFVGAYAVFEHSHKAFGSRDFDPFFEKLVDLGFPLVIHGGRSSRHDTPDSDSMRTWSETSCGHQARTAMLYAANMINTGVFDKYPDLNVLIQEAGFTWAPFLAQHMDELVRTFSEDFKVVPRIHEMGQEYLQRQPSEYVFDNLYFDTQPFSLTRNEQHARALLEMCHADEQLTFSSDWPHVSMDMPWRISDHPAVDADLQERIFDKNLRGIMAL